VGDQLRARGTHSADGSSLVAAEIVSGAFRNISGTVTAIDSGAGTMTVNDLVTKQPVMVKVNGTSQLKKLPQPMAQRIAARLKGSSGEAESAAAGAGQRPVGQPGSSSTATAPRNEQPAGQPGGNRGEQGMAIGDARGAGGGQGGAPDLQQAIGRMPAATLADLQKGDAVMIVATATAQGDVMAITVLAGVEPILQASGGQSILTPWSLSSAPGGDAAAQ
jgi:hypothetical protein